MIPSWLVALIVAVIQVFLPILRNEVVPRAEEGKRDAALKNRLRARVRAAGWACLLVVALLVGGCARTVYVPSGEPVRLRETIRAAKVWVLDATGTPTPGTMTLMEGWYVLPDSTPE